ncbi:MAG: hypothetical protein P8N49_02255 [Opitutales bacterium]|nr:hypothetical protein [Opitutales bacterium]
METYNKKKLGNILFLPVALACGILGFGSPVFFATVSESSLQNVGEGTKSMEEEVVRQLRQNNLGPAEMLLPLTKVDRRKEFAKVIEKKKIDHPELSISGGGSIFDMLTFNEYFGGLDKYNLARGRFEAFFVYNRATTRGDLWDRLGENSSNDNVLAVLKAIPEEGRPGNFWARLLAEPLVSAFPGVKVAKLVDFPFFPNRHIVLSVGLRTANDLDGNLSEAEIRDLCLAEARQGILDYSGNAEWFKVQRVVDDSTVVRLDGNQTFPSLDLTSFSERTGMLKVGRTDDGGYAVIVGGIVNTAGELENHGRWLPYPILIPMMVGTAMSLEKEYYTSDTAFEIGRLSQKMLQGDFESKERIRSFFWAAHQLARKMNLIQMAELTQSCPNLQSIFDLSALIRMRNRPLSEAIGKIKAANRELGFLPMNEREDARAYLRSLIEEKRVVERDFEKELQIIYSATLLSSNPTGVYQFVKNYPVFKKDGDLEAAVSALGDLRIAMSHGKGALDHLLLEGKPIHEDGPFLSTVSTVFPLLGGGLLTFLSHSQVDLALLLKMALICGFFYLFILFIGGILPDPSYKRSRGNLFLRWVMQLSGATLLLLFSILALEPSLLQSPRGQVSVAGFDFALANLLAYANEESMADQNLTEVTAIIAGAFLLVQVVIFMICLSRVSEVKQEEGSAKLRLSLLDNEDNLFDLGLYVGLGGTVLSLILLLILDVKQDALIGAYTSTLFGILFVAALKIFIVRPLRNDLLRQMDDKRYES